MAFGIKEPRTREYRDDPHFIKWVARYTIEKNAEKHQQYFPLNRCTDVDFDLFAQPDQRSAKEIEQLRRDGGLFCLDWEVA